MGTSPMRDLCPIPPVVVGGASCRDTERRPGSRRWPGSPASCWPSAGTSQSGPRRSRWRRWPRNLRRDLRSRCAVAEPPLKRSWKSALSVIFERADLRSGRAPEGAEKKAVTLDRPGASRFRPVYARQAAAPRAGSCTKLPGWRDGPESHPPSRSTARGWPGMTRSMSGGIAACARSAVRSETSSSVKMRPTSLPW